jgi:hypothetical protein
METTVLADPEVEAELERFVSIRLYTDGYPPERALRNQKFQEEHFANVALPFFAFYDARGKLVRTHQGTAGKTEFLDLLRGVR